MRIHFVCDGNTYRSRLAEAYFNSKELIQHVATSSGVKRNSNYDKNGPISWYAMRLIKNHNLIPFITHDSVQTTNELLKDADLVIFMENEVYQFARSNFQFEESKCRIWNIPDLHQFRDEEISLTNEVGRIRATTKTFNEIKEKVNELIAEEKLS